ncbi:unnamed protein product [Gongylonema pulchrum]|uniref:G_PROTEIN_RECEP_F1_2 domain-containing protein n=1 Tax=Gongylonema pulchrum TaxID=637853 RepID=A0A183ESY6_9BILA|nr:unnamed protein product [Gongylonema pulchrum]
MLNLSFRIFKVRQTVLGVSSILAVSTLISSMLRISGACRANIDEIANHCWLNYDENTPTIRDLPENQVQQAAFL